MDTALTLQIAEAHAIVMRQMTGLEDALCTRALEHRDTVVMGRSHQLHTVPTTFGVHTCDLGRRDQRSHRPGD